jgi:hypothetical protein
MAERDWDWNATIWILDTLSEDAYSFVELSDYIGRIYGRDVIGTSLKLLERQGLISVLEGSPIGSDMREVAEVERSKRIQSFFEIVEAERRGSIANWLSISDNGRSLLELIGIGHPS